LISENYLQWSNPNATCHIPDVVGYQLYFTSDYNSDYQLIYTAQTPNDTTYIHSNLSSVVGCYYVQSVDSVNNLSLPSNKVCIELDSCRLYSLPNVFTPNGDGYNDQFIPFPYDFVERVDMKIFNRWGMVVFQTEDPDINWDGVDITSKQPSSDGVYFYVCEVYEHRLQGLTQRTLKGTVSLYR
jgi:gliding motility-associated-like protein